MYKTPVVVEAVSFVENRRHVSVFQWIYNNIMIIIIRTHKCSLTFIRILFFLEHMWRRQWQPTPVLLPGKSHGRRSLIRAFLLQGELMIQTSILLQPW